MHDGVALACGALEPGPVQDLDLPSVGGDEPGLPQARKCHGDTGPADAEHEPEEVVGEMKRVGADAIVGHEQPARGSLRRRVQPVARDSLADLCLRLARLEERKRVASVLHDQVIYSMFAVGLNLQGAMELVAEPAGQQRLEHAIQQVDRIITEIRAFVFEVASTQPPQDQPAC